MDGYPLTIEVQEFHPQRSGRHVFHATNGFLLSSRRFVRLRSIPDTGLFTVLEDPMFTVKAVALNHRIPSFAYALEEQFHINVNKQKLHEAGLPVGGWLKDVKQYVWAGKAG